MLRRLQPVREFKACFDGPPRHEAKSREPLVSRGLGPRRHQLVDALAALANVLEDKAAGASPAGLW